MSFAVDLPVLRGVPDMLGRLAESAQKCRFYVEDNFDFDFGPGIINRVTGRHAEVRGEVREFFYQMERVAGAERDAVTAAIHSYEKTDERNTARLDALLPVTRVDHTEGRSPRLRPDFIQTRVVEQAHPADALVEVPDYSRENPYQPQWGDLVSPGNIARDAVWSMTWLGAKLGICDRAYDPLDEIVLPMTGNWAGMHGCADALANLAKATGMLRSNIDWVALRVEASWLGNAADACWAHLRKISHALEEAERALKELGGLYAAVVQDMKFLETTMELIVIDLIDAAFFASAATAATSTGVGVELGVVFGVATVYEIVKLVGHVNDVLSYIEKGKGMLDAFDGEVAGVGLLGGDRAHLPAVPGR